jgi:hypothetical protein
VVRMQQVNGAGMDQGGDRIAWARVPRAPLLRPSESSMLSSSRDNIPGFSCSYSDETLISFTLRCRFACFDAARLGGCSSCLGPALPFHVD